jgi:hypothetical protein
MRLIALDANYVYRIQNGVIDIQSASVRGKLQEERLTSERQKEGANHLVCLRAHNGDPPMS